MKRTILYYPTIAIPTNSWLRNSLLYWDDVSSIVPQSWEGQFLTRLSPDINYLIDEGQFRAVKPDHLIDGSWENLHAFEDEFKAVISSDKFKAFLERKPFSRSEVHIDKLRGSKMIARIHHNKTSGNIFDFLKDRRLASRDRHSDEWLIFEGNTALIYMSLLAKHIAAIDKNQTTIGTDFNIYEKFNFQRVNSNSGFPVVSLNLLRMLPCPVANVPLEKIVDFKRRRNDELLYFRKFLMDFQNKISRSKSPEELKEHAISFQEGITVGMKTLTATLKDYKIETVTKSLKSLVSLKSVPITSALGLMDHYHPLLDKPIALSLKIAGVVMAGAIELTANYIEVRNKSLSKTRDSAFSYLLQAQRAGIIKHQ